MERPGAGALLGRALGVAVWLGRRLLPALDVRSTEPRPCKYTYILSQARDSAQVCMVIKNNKSRKQIYRCPIHTETSHRDMGSRWHKQASPPCTPGPHTLQLSTNAPCILWGIGAAFRGSIAHPFEAAAAAAALRGTLRPPPVPRQLPAAERDCVAVALCRLKGTRAQCVVQTFGMT